MFAEGVVRYRCHLSPVDFRQTFGNVLLPHQEMYVLLSKVMKLKWTT